MNDETNRIQVTRSAYDSFRDKIANALAKSVEDNPRGDVYDLADAVIRELDLIPTASGYLTDSGDAK